VLEYKGIGSKGRRKQLKDLMSKYRVDVICLHETIKEQFTLSELKGLVGGQCFAWNWIASKGHSGEGGTLMGVKQGDLDAVEMDEGQFFSSVMVVNK
jgi:exonuclease III